MASTPTIRFRCVTLRRSGANDIRIVQAADADAARARLIAAGLEPISIEALGPSLFERLFRHDGVRGTSIKARLSAWRLPRIDVSRPLPIGAMLALATIPFTIAAGSWGLTFAIGWRADRLADRAAPQIAAWRAHQRVEAARARAAPIMAGPAASAVLTRLAGILPADTGLASIGRDEAGMLTIQIDTPDPDRIRPILGADPLFGALRETGQAATDDGAIRVTLKGRVA